MSKARADRPLWPVAVAVAVALALSVWWGMVVWRECRDDGKSVAYCARMITR